MKMFWKNISRRYHHPDYHFLIILGLLVVLGLIVLTSASGVVGLRRFNDTYYFVKHQILTGFIVGGILFFVFSYLDYRKLKKVALPLFIISLFLSILVFVPGIGYSRGEAQRWIAKFGFTFQPAELLKLALLIYLATLFDTHKKKIKTWSGGLLPTIILFAVAAILVLLQKDMGTLVVIFAIVVMVYFLAGARWLHWLTLVGGAVVMFGIMMLAVPYRMNRFLTFFDSSIDPLGIGYHITQALIAIGSGGLFGLGLGHSRQKFLYLPESYGDSIFAVVGEEMGFILTTLFIFLFFYLALRGLKIAKKAPDGFGQLLGAGIICWFLAQAVVNIGAMLHLFPLTGIPLPLVSYGGSSMMVFLAAFGILFNISRQTIE